MCMILLGLVAFIVISFASLLCLEFLAMDSDDDDDTPTSGDGVFAV